MTNDACESEKKQLKLIIYRITKKLVNSDKKYVNYGKINSNYLIVDSHILEGILMQTILFTDLRNEMNIFICTEI